MPATIELQATPLFQKNFDVWDSYKIIVNQGGTRSSKTTSLAQILITKLAELENKIVTIARKTTPSLRSSVMRDFFNILKESGLYFESNHNKSNNEYILHNNLVEFISMDVSEKKKGTKRDFLWLNEATEFDYQDFFQLSIRTSDKIILDYNPDYEYHWIYDKVLPRKDCVMIKSTYKDNPFLEESLIGEIEQLRDTDENLWRIYGLGEIGRRKVIVFDNWDLTDTFPPVDDISYGIDFGFNNPSALVKCCS